MNIVNSVQTPDFINGISGVDFKATTEDQNQARRRFPIIIPMRFYLDTLFKQRVF